jgi:hypothetical protein
MTSNLESASSPASEAAGEASPRWLKLGIVAAASALAGGLAAAWWYRKTLTKLREAEESPPDPHSGISGDNSADDL